ncbi:hypothetical protein FQR65_LT14066 [Abscondita terminalis]|nr:hypothetical protein FQR65_LT14066 [Abscondita terminalis]
MLVLSDLRPDDKMNYSSAQKMCSLSVINNLENIPQSQEAKVDLATRLRRICYVVFFLRIWRTWVKRSEEYTLKDNFLSNNCYLSIEINAHNLVKLINIFKTSDGLRPDIFNLNNFSSQTCEKLFRAARSITSTFSTIINFSIKDLMHRINRIATINSIKHDLSEKFLFPREEKKALSKLVDLSKEDLLKLDVEREIMHALNDALLDGESVGIRLIAEEWKYIDVPLCLSEPVEELDLHDVEIDNDQIEINEDHDGTDFLSKIVLGCEEKDSGNDAKQFSTLKLVDYSKKISNLSVVSPFVEVQMENGKKIVVKKSSLCWFLDENNGRVSTDRLRRFMVRNKGAKEMRNSQRKRKVQTIKNQTKKKLRKTDQKKETSITSDETEAEDISLDSTDIDWCSESSKEESHSDDKILLENNYAVYYDEDWYIGRAISETIKGEYKVKFLKSQLNYFIWPKHDDIDTIKRNFIFYGPMELIGSGPFELKRSDFLNICKQYKLTKKLVGDQNSSSSQVL